MKKHTYRAQKVNNMNWQQVNEQSAGEALVLAVDVAKVQQYALLTNQEHTQTWLMQWSHLEHTQYLIEQLKTLEVPITVVMESTSTYGDSLRYQCRQAGFTIFQANAKKVHDAREIYDGVPSLHDAKAAWLIAKLDKVQRGEQPDDFKPMPSIGKGVEEIRVWDESGAYQVIYTARLAEVVYVLHAFQKRTQATSKRDIELASKRYAELIRGYYE